MPNRLKAASTRPRWKGSAPLRALTSTARGVAAVEFALVGLPFIIFVLFLMELGYDLYAQESLDYAVQTAARNVEVGNAQSAGSMTGFKATFLCPAVGALIPCDAIAVNVQVIPTDFFSAGAETIPLNSKGQLSTSGFVFCPGQPKQLMLLQAVYTSPSLLAELVPGMATATADGFVHVTMASTAFINENFPMTSVIPAGC
jgi:Flp pilus assembly protein TadG